MSSFLQEFFYDLLQDESSSEPEAEVEEEEEEDNMYGHIIFTPHVAAADAKTTRSRRSVPALMPAR